MIRLFVLYEIFLLNKWGEEKRSGWSESDVEVEFKIQFLVGLESSPPNCHPSAHY